MYSVPSGENVTRSQRSDEEMLNKETYESDFGNEPKYFETDLGRVR